MFDVAVVVLSLAVVGSLALLALTFAVTGVRAAHEGRRRVAGLRADVAEAEARLPRVARKAHDTLTRLRAHRAGDRSDR